MPVFAVLAACSAHAGYSTAYAWLKPIPMLLMLGCVWRVADRQRHPRSTWLLLIGLAFSLQGDVWLLFERGFIPGLISFWLAHACYIALFRRDTPWQPTRWSIVACGCGMLVGVTYLYLWRNGLPADMRLPVAAYVLVIGYMATQAIARAAAFQTPASYCVAAGAVCFMASDTVLAINKFVSPVPAADLWILGTYYLAQWLIVLGMLQVLHKPATNRKYIKI